MRLLIINESYYELILFLRNLKVIKLEFFFIYVSKKYKYLFILIANRSHLHL